MLRLSKKCIPTKTNIGMKAQMQNSAEGTAYYSLGNYYKWSFKESKVKEMTGWEFFYTYYRNKYAQESNNKKHFLTRTPIYLSCNEHSSGYV